MFLKRFSVAENSYGDCKNQTPGLKQKQNPKTRHSKLKKLSENTIKMFTY